MKNIDPNKSLPSNTIYDWSECFAKLVIEYAYPNKLFNLKIEDKPDLQSLKYDLGIEVTTAESRDSLELDKLYIALEEKNIKI